MSAGNLRDFWWVNLVAENDVEELSEVVTSTAGHREEVPYRMAEAWERNRPIEIELINELYDGKLCAV